MRYKKEEKEKWVADWKVSGKSRWSFAKEQGLCPQTFCKWIKKKEKAAGFVELRPKVYPISLNIQEFVLERGETKMRVPSNLSQEEMNTAVTLWRSLP